MVLENKFDITDSAELARVEERISKAGKCRSRRLTKSLKNM